MLGESIKGKRTQHFDSVDQKNIEDEFEKEDSDRIARKH